MITQRRIIQDMQGRQREASWEVDTSLLGSVQAWARDQARAERELQAMAEMYPAWTLTLAAPDGKALARAGCADLAVPACGAWRWASDGQLVSEGVPAAGGRVVQRLLAALSGQAAANSPGALLWEGLLPAPLAGLPKCEQLLSRKFPVEAVGGKPWTAVPVRVLYPHDFPRSEPAVSYGGKWLQTLRVAASSTYHIYGDGRLCLFYPGHWKRGYTGADVLSRRVVNHMYSILKVAEGTDDRSAFIGRVDNAVWKPGK